MRRIIEPLGNHVLVEPVPVEEVTAGGIIKPEAYKQPSTEGVVVAVGDCMKNIDRINVGDRVIYNWIQGREVNMDGKMYRLLDAAEILGKIKAI